MKYFSVFILALIPSLSFAGSFDVSCVDKAKTIKLDRDTIEVDGKTYQHSGVNDLFGIEQVGFKGQFELDKKQGTFSLATSKVLSEHHESDCRDYDSYKVSVTAEITVVGQKKKMVALQCDVSSVSSRGGRSCDSSK